MAGLIIGLVVVVAILVGLAIKNHKDKHFADELPNNEAPLEDLKQPQEFNGYYGFKNDDSFLKFGTEVLNKMVKADDVDVVTEISEGALNAVLGSINSWDALPEEEKTKEVESLLATNKIVVMKGSVKHPESNNKMLIYVVERYGANSIIGCPL